MKNKALLTAAGGIAAVAISMGTVVGVVNAQQPSPTPSAGATAPGGGQSDQRRQQMEQRMNEHLDRLARNLGVAPERLRDAMKQTALQEVDAALAAGTITAEQAQRAKDAINAGNVRGFSPGGAGGRMGRGGPDDGKERGGVARVANDQLATFLGVTPAQLRTELEGKSLAQVAQAHGKTRDQLKAFITTNAREAAAQRVRDGKITQQAADTMLNQLTQRLDTMIDRVHQARGNRN